MDLVEELVNVVGKNVITNKAKSLRFRKGTAQVRAMQLQSYFQPL